MFKERTKPNLCRIEFLLSCDPTHRPSMSPSATDAPRLCPTPVILCTSAHGKRGKTSREKTYQQSPPGMMSKGNTKPTTVLVRTSCHMESAPRHKDLQPSRLPGLQKFHLWQALEAHPCHQAISSCVLQQ